MGKHFSDEKRRQAVRMMAGLVLIALCVVGYVVLSTENIAENQAFAEQFNGHKIFLGPPILQTIASGLNLAAVIFLLIRLACGKRHELLPGEIVGPAPTWLLAVTIPLFFITGDSFGSFGSLLFALLLLLTGLAILFCFGYAIHLFARLAFRRDTAQLTPLNCFATLTGICMCICWINSALFLWYLPI